MLMPEEIKAVAKTEFNKLYTIDTFRYKYDPKYKSDVDFRVEVFTDGFSTSYEMMIRQEIG